ncbi:tissue factor pathway inhibitor-like isoform X2 [Sphaeramia orbicularis]|uniref:tissue factor pathway inhibitor-like isoform X2 n=1 Tax=Sphaeramia orbicularis TaxID=375764 RepID=UPI00117EFA05|nr:tissue factor pathway inhibitor-like isoform X2 [Sphaeramia orbicularis]
MWWTLCVLCVCWVCCTGHRTDGAPPELFIFNELCALKDDPGPCKAIKERFFFSVDTGRCEAFEYGGCGGNTNNFDTLQACEEMCLVSVDKNPCGLPEAAGPCRGLVKRYFFDTRTEQCRPFFYGGCFGNANNFRSMSACQARCHSSDKPSSAPEVQTQAPPRTERLQSPVGTGEMPVSASVVQLNASHPLPNDGGVPSWCFSPADRGTCDGSSRRFAFNPDTRRCHMFVFSGCGGNQNNFSHRRHCMRKCTGRTKDRGMKMIRIRKKNMDIVSRSV